MSRTFRGPDRQIRVRSIRKPNPDPARFARILVDYARAQKEKEAEVEARRIVRLARRVVPSPPDTPSKGDAA